MVLVDTSVWVAHFRIGNAKLKNLLNEGSVLSHPFIAGELACGNLKKRTDILSLFKWLPAAVLAQHGEVMELIENYSLMGKGLGYIDMHLLASTLLTNVPLWTLDKKLHLAAVRLRAAF